MIPQSKRKMGRLCSKNRAALTLPRKPVKKKKPQRSSELIFLHYIFSIHNKLIMPKPMDCNLNEMKCGALKAERPVPCPLLLFL